MRKTVSVAVACSVLVVLAGGPARAADPTSPTEPSTSRVYVVGDSITSGSRSTLQAMRPGWHINGLRGRLVSTLPMLVSEILAVDPNPRVVVLALGTNASWSWSKAEYLAAVDLLPTTTRVLLVTTYRDPDNWSRYAKDNWDGIDRPWYQRAYIQSHYSTWMREIDVERANVCVAEWRGLVRNRPWLMFDGVHPNPNGHKKWADLLVTGVRNCAAP